MACQTTRQLLNHVADFHRKLGRLYSQQASEADRDRARALLEYMGSHEAHLAECLARYKEVAADTILDSWFQFTPDIAECECFECVEVSPDMSVDDVVRAALWFDDCLIQFFRDMAEHSVSGDVKELFLNLASMEEQEEHKAARAALELTEGV